MSRRKPHFSHEMTGWISAVVKTHMGRSRDGELRRCTHCGGEHSKWLGGEKVESLLLYECDNAKPLPSDLVEDGAARIAELEEELAQLREAIRVKGGTEHAPTQDAYEAACAALHAQRRRAEQAEAALKRCAEWFEGYARIHGAKGAEDKAQRNRDRAEFARFWGRA